MQWICSVCGYIHDDDEPPDYCYDCGAPGSNFSEWNEDDEDMIQDSFSDDFDDVDVDNEEGTDDDDRNGRDRDGGDVKLDDFD